MNIESFQSRKKFDVFGYHFDPISFGSLVDQVIQWADRDAARSILLCNVNLLMAATKSKAVGEALRAADLLVPVGRPLGWVQEWRSYSKSAQIFAPDLLIAVSERAERAGITVGLCGGDVQSLNRVMRLVLARSPNCKIASVIPTDRLLGNEDAINEIEDSGVGILFVAMDSPQQELWIQQNRDRLRAVVISVGHTFRFLAEGQSRAPKWMQRSGLEWVYSQSFSPDTSFARTLAQNVQFFLRIVYEEIFYRPSPTPTAQEQANGSVTAWSYILGNFAAFLFIIGGLFVSEGIRIFPGEPQSFVWLPVGLSVGIMLRWGVVVSPGVVIGLSAASCVYPPVEILPRAICDIAAVFGAVLLARSVEFNRRFGRESDVLYFSAGVAGLFPIVGGIILGVISYLSGWSSLARSIWDVFAEILGIFVVVPVITIFRKMDWLELGWGSRIRFLILLIFVLVLNYGDLWIGTPDDLYRFPARYLGIPLLHWIALDFGLGFAGLALLGATLTFSKAYSTQVAQITDANMAISFFSYYLYNSLLSISLLLVGTIVRRRKRAERRAAAAMQAAKLAGWEWRPGLGLRLESPEWARLFRSRANERVDPSKIQEIVHSDDRFSLMFWRTNRDSLLTGNIEEFRIQVQGGDVRWLSCRSVAPQPEDASVPGTLYGVFQDITHEKAIEAERRDALAREVQLRNYKLSIHPHFLFNSLNTIRSLISTNTEDSREFITSLAGFLRGTLGDVDADFVTFDHELMLVSHYLKMEHFRFGERLRYRIEASPEAKRSAFPPMVLQTLVENAVKYGVSRNAAGGEITISASCTDQTLCVTVQNDGKLAVTKEDSTGRGLKLSSDRLKLLFGEGAEIRLFETQDDHVVAEVRIPVRRFDYPRRSPRPSESKSPNAP